MFVNFESNSRNCVSRGSHRASRDANHFIGRLREIYRRETEEIRFLRRLWAARARRGLSHVRARDLRFSIASAQIAAGGKAARVRVSAQSEKEKRRGAYTRPNSAISCWLRWLRLSDSLEKVSIPSESRNNPNRRSNCARFRRICIQRPATFLRAASALAANGNFHDLRRLIKPRAALIRIHLHRAASLQLSFPRMRSQRFARSRSPRTERGEPRFEQVQAQGWAAVGVLLARFPFLFN